VRYNGNKGMTDDPNRKEGEGAQSEGNNKKGRGKKKKALGARRGKKKSGESMESRMDEKMGNDCGGILILTNLERGRGGERGLVEKRLSGIK